MSSTPIRPWLAAILAAFALFTTTVPLIAAAPRAQADDPGNDGFYVDLLTGVDAYNQYNEQTLLQEGHKICSAIHQGASEDSATGMVQSDLGPSNYQAYRIVSAAESGLGCASLKTHGM